MEKSLFDQLYPYSNPSYNIDNYELEFIGVLEQKRSWTNKNAKAYQEKLRLPSYDIKDL